jgi:hypothetical protein
MMLLIRLFIFSILFFNNLNDTPKDKSLFISPLKIPQLLSANFGELRIDHFHSGIDIKTQGVIGQEVVAAANGYISRISITPGGFGNALYITHPSGYTTVYGHLDRFTSKIEAYVKARQYEKKSFVISLFPTKEDFPVKQGELIAYSGNSGGSGGPHLHFEIRKSDSERPINPLLFDFGMVDNIKPVIEKLVIYPINSHSTINNGREIKKINVVGSRGVYTIAGENEISVSGLTGFGIKAFDMLNDSPNKCAVHSINLSIDSTPVFKYIMDGFSFTESRFVNSHIDYETFMRENIYIERAWVLPNDKLNSYKDVINRGLYNFDDNKSHSVEFVVADANNNKSVLTFHVRSQAKKIHDALEIKDKEITVMPYSRANKFTSENISVTIPEGALYDTLDFSFKKEKGTSTMYSDVFSVHNKYTPVQKPFTISLKPTSIAAGKESKMLIIRYADDRKIAASSYWDGPYLSADVLSFGQYFIGIDTVPPGIFAIGLSNGINLSGKKEMRVRITDELSGIKSYEGTIDGKWALFEYDQKNEMLNYKFDEARITKGSKHTLVLKVSDNKENSSTYNCNFTW